MRSPAAKMQKPTSTVIARVVAYGPLLITIGVLVIQTFAPSFIKSLPIPATSAILAGSVVFLAWHVEGTIDRYTLETKDLESRLTQLESTQTEFIDATTCLAQMKLGAAFGAVCSVTHRINHLRVLAISSQQILSFLKFHEVSIDRCDVLLRSFDPKDVKHRDFLNQIRLVVADWRRLEREGRVQHLELRFYDFHPTEYECIFDLEHLMLGLYDSDPDDYSGVRVRDPVLISNTSDAGRIMIAEFADRFDRLFETCATHHGRNTLD